MAEDEDGPGGLAVREEPGVEVAVVVIVDKTTKLTWDSEQTPPEPSRLLAPPQPAFWLFKRTFSIAPVLRGQAK